MIENAQEFKPLYEELLSSVKGVEGELYPFFVQVGEGYEQSKHRILFVGKATNGWHSTSRNVDELFNQESKECINRVDQMRWLSNQKGETYNINKSAFWRLIRETVDAIEQPKENDWYEYIAWSNLYKISPKLGNPCPPLINKQRSACIKILEKEIQILKPKVVVFLTTGWESHFLENCSLLGELKSQYDTTKKLGNYEIKSKVINGITYIRSVHPQGKKGKPYASILAEMISPQANLS
ncbi:MAG: hypothetical protein ACRC4W_05510 [Treponemataceae bacterium]